MPNPLATRREGDSFRFSLTLANPAGAPDDAARLSDELSPFLAGKGVEAGPASALHTALEELITNLGKFGRDDSAPAGAPPLRAEGEIHVDSGGVELRLRDNGREFDPTLQPAPVFTDDPDELVPGGLGLFMLRAMFTAFAYRRTDGENRSEWTIRYD